ncbi:MAG: protein kinase, partial [Candidatus Promineifilaceae bacterium]|nr:protein kinase [Candidatus Promineifilaceae bacterium]
MSNLSIRLLGPLQVEAAGKPLSSFASDKARALLAYLATAADQPHRRDKLAGLLWPNSPQKTARTNLRRALADLRKAIGDLQAVPPYLLITRQTIRFNSSSDVWVDISAFLAAQPVWTGSHPLDQQALQQLEMAADLYRDHFLEGFFVGDSLAFEEWALLMRERFQRQVLLLLHRLVAHFEGCKAYERAVPYAWRQVELDPFQEPAQREIMRLLANTGQRAAALAQYKALKNLLAVEMGMAPSARTSALYEKIRSGALDLVIVSEPGVRGYELHEQIGAGQYGAVYRAIQPGVGREVAVKVIRSQYADRLEFIRRFEAEAQLVARLEHPYIVPLYDYWRDPDGAYLVMRLLKGGSLQELLGKGPLALDAAVTLIEQIASALSVAHRQGIVHGDIKAANILLDEDRNAYLSDFGIARVVRQEIAPPSAEDALSPSRTISPELLRNEPLTPLTDLYGLGLLLYELLTGSNPFAGLSTADWINRCLQEPLPLAREQRSDLPPAIDDVIQRAADNTPAKRFPDAQAFASAVRSAAGAYGLSPILTMSSEACRKPINPYKGLRAFQEADADLFFGRSTLIQQLLSLLAPARFLAVVGPSGSGKSSVVRAGLIPALRRGAVPGSENWLLIEMTPGTQPLAELATALLPVAVNPPPTLLQPLQKDDRGLSRVLKRILPVNDQSERSPILLLIDQFEELFTLVEDEATRSHFLESLLAAAQDPLLQLRIVATLRADFYDRPLQYPRLGELLRQNTALVLPLSPAELEQAICSPSAGAGVRVEPQLTVTMMAD